MKRRSLYQTLLLAWLLIFLFSACAAPFSVQPVTTITSLPAVTPRPATPTSVPATNVPTPVQAVATPSETPPLISSPPVTLRPPSGWTVYTNPDFVQGIAIHEKQLWAATLGGVIKWDLITGKATQFTTRDGLVEVQANDVVYCSMPEERIVVAHPTGILSVYDLKLKDGAGSRSLSATEVR